MVAVLPIYDLSQVADYLAAEHDSRKGTLAANIKFQALYARLGMGSAIQPSIGSLSNG